MFLLIDRSLNIALQMVVMSVTFGAWLQLSPALLSFSGPDYVKVQQTVLSRLKKFMPFVLLLALISTTLDVVLVRSDGAGPFDFTVLALLCFVTFLFVTIRYELPINQDIENWDPDQPPDEWAAIRGRWEKWQTVRAWLSVGTLASLIGALLVSAGCS